MWAAVVQYSFAALFWTQAHTVANTHRNIIDEHSRDFHLDGKESKLIANAHTIGL